MDAGQAEVVAPLRALGGTGALLNIFRTMARTPKALKRFNLWGGYLLGGGSALPVRKRELLILRTGWLCRSGYEWVQHKSMGVEAGLTDSEIERIKQGPDAPGWSAADAALPRAADELVADQFVADATWAALGGLTERQRMSIGGQFRPATHVNPTLRQNGVGRLPSESAWLGESPKLDPRNTGGSGDPGMLHRDRPFNQNAILA